MSALLPTLQGTDAWREARYAGIGSSEAAAAAGADPDTTPEELVAEKLRLIPPIAETPDMRLGKLLEPLIAQLYAEQTGRRVKRVNALLQHPRHSFVLASLDRETYGRRGDRRIVELKKRRGARDYGEPGTDQVPERVLYQVQQQMAVHGVPLADIAVWDGNLPEILVFHVEADREFQELLFDVEADLWRYVERGELPPQSVAAPWARPVYAGDLEADVELAVLAERVAELRARLRDDKTQADDVEQLLITAIGEHKRILGRDFRITLVAGREQTRTAWQKVAEAYRALAVELWAALEMQPGVRPFPLALSEKKPLESLYATTSEVKPSLRLSGALFEKGDDTND